MKHVIPQVSGCLFAQTMDTEEVSISSINEHLRNPNQSTCKFYKCKACVHTCSISANLPLHGVCCLTNFLIITSLRKLAVLVSVGIL